MAWPETHSAVHTMPAIAMAKNIPVAPDRPKLSSTSDETMMVSIVMPEAGIVGGGGNSVGGHRCEEKREDERQYRALR